MSETDRIRLETLTPDMAGIAAGIHARAFPARQAWDAGFIARLLSLPGGAGLCAMRPDGPAGFILWSLTAGEGEILTLAVLPERRRKGIGGRLLAAAMSDMGMRGARRVFLDVDVRNGAAVSLYRRAGFARTGCRKGYYRGPDGGRSDAIVMMHIFGEGCGCDPD